MKKKVLFCIPPNCGGAERVTLTIAKLLDREQYDITIVIVGKKKGEIVKSVPDYFDVVHVKIRNIWDFTTFRLVRLFRKICPDIVFCSLMYLNIRVLLAAKIVGNIRTIIRNNNSISTLRFDNLLLVKMLYSKADAIILQTDEMKSEVLQHVHIKPYKLHVIFNPIDVEGIQERLVQSSSPFQSQYINYVFVGRIEYCKGLDVLIPAFAHLLRIRNNCKLYLVGKISETNEYYHKLQRLISSLELDDRVVWTGFTDNPYIYMRYADCLVLPSRREGLPNVVLEAMYLKTPVVVTRSVPVIDRIVSSKRGIVIDVEDVEALTKAMNEVVNINIVADYQQISINEWLDIFA